MHIRDERPEDAATISTVTEAAFAANAATPARIEEALRAAGMTAAHVPDPGSHPSEARIVERLRREGALTLSLVGEADDGIVAHVAFSPVRIGSAVTGWHGLGPVSVRPDLQRRGLGSALIREGLRRLQALGAEGCVLLGYPPYYARFGFEHDPALTYGGYPNPALQRLVFSGPAPAGEVLFHPAFAG